MHEVSPPDTFRPRYAIYFAPDACNAWWTHWSAWLGRCAVAKQALAQPVIEGLSAEEFFSITATPRGYGWHATLKAPFRLAEGIGRPQLVDALAALCAAHRTFALPALEVRRLNDFLALTLAQPCLALEHIAADCVTKLEGLRAPLAEDEVIKRRATGLTPQQEAHLLRWGYPYVLDTFRFHFSLTGSLTGLNAAQADALARAAQLHLHALNKELLRFDAVCIFEQAHASADFVLTHRFMLA